jgi:hypothetical protein
MLTPLAALSDAGRNIAFGGLLMFVVGLAVMAAARRRWGVPWRWLGGGALLWGVAMVEKRILDALLNGPPQPGPLSENLPNPLHLPASLNVLAASVYNGLFTGVTEVALLLVAGLLYLRFTRGRIADARCAVGLGLGAGVGESLYFGFMDIVAGVATAAHATISFSAATAILVPPVERLIVIPCHAAAAAMVFYAVATRRWRWFGFAFVFFSALDALCGFYIITGALDPAQPWRTNPWLIELSFAPFGVMSILIILHLRRNWPPAPAIAPTTTPLPTPPPPPTTPTPRQLAGESAPTPCALGVPAGFAT